MRPSETLEHQVALVKWWRTDAGVDFANGFVAQTRLTAGHEALFPEGWDGAYFAEIQAHALDRAETFWVTADMVKLTHVAAKSMPEQPLRPYDLPCRAGFVWLEDPFEVQDPRGEARYKVRGIMWSPGRVTLPDAAAPTEMDGLNISLYVEVPKGYSKVAAPLVLFTSVPWVYGYSYADRPEGVEEADAEVPAVILDAGITARRFMAAFWTLVQQKLTSTTYHRADRHTRRRIERAGKPLEQGDSVKIVTLRKLVQRDKDDEHEPSSVDWSHRWIVDGHWRNQYFPSIKGHRQIFVGPYVKGPDSKPLVIKDRVYKVAR